MNKIYKLLLATLVFASALTLSAFASNFDSAAQELETLGLFQGTPTGYELDRAPTRAEASVMLVRLLGGETDAETQFAEETISHPFNDVPSWAAPYVAWLYSNELANGVSPTQYGSSNECSAQMYCAFVLRALGYSDAASGDFSYTDAEEFAQSKGISVISGEDFLRDDAVALSYQALATEISAGTKPLLTHLVDEGAVSQDTAAPLLEKITTYRSYLADCALWDNIKAMDMSVDYTMALEVPAMDTNMNIQASSTIKTIINDNDIQMEAIIDTEDGTGGITTISEWLKDGYLYMDTGTEKYKTALDYSLMLETVSEQSMYSDVSIEGLYMIDSISSTETQAGTLYSIVFSDDMNDLVNQLVSGLGAGEINSISMNNMKYDVLIGDDGIPISINMTFSITMDMTIEGETMGFSCDYIMYCDINSIGDDVVITFPDFSVYTEQDAA